eukprot:9504069-Pyramimonas_sp.AAC.2
MLALSLGHSPSTHTSVELVAFPLPFPLPPAPPAALPSPSLLTSPGGGGWMGETPSATASRRGDFGICF